MLGKKGKIFVLAGMIALLVVTGVLNIYLNKSAQKANACTDTSTSADFFAAYRTDRTETRNQTIMYLDAIIKDEASSEDAVKKAEDDKLALTSAMDTELVLEGLIKAAGFEDAVVTSSTENVNIIIKSASLTSEQVAKVLEIVTSETGKTASNVRIIPVE